MFDRQKSAGHLTSWAGRLFSRSLDRRIKPLMLSVGQVPILLILAEAGELSQKDLVNRAAIEQPAMAAILKRMEASALVRRCTDPADGRSSLFSLTGKARDVLRPLTKVLDEGNRQALSGLSVAEKTLFIAMLQRVIHNLASEDDLASAETNRAASVSKTALGASIDRRVYDRRQ